MTLCFPSDKFQYLRILFLDLASMTLLLHHPRHRVSQGRTFPQILDVLKHIYRLTYLKMFLQ